MTRPITPANPPAPPKNTLPNGVALSKFWRETEGGPIVQHDHDRPIDETTAEPVGVWWMCPATDTCKTGEWVFRSQQTGDPGQPKKKFCAEHGAELLPGRSDPADDDPQASARNWLQQRIAEKTALAKKAARLATQQRIDSIRRVGRDEADRLRSDLREHVPSAGVSLGALVANWALLYELDTLPTYALGAGIMVGGTVLAYVAVYWGELVWARRMGYTIRELPEKIRAHARSHARWIGAGVMATGVWLVIAETIGARLDNLWGVLANMMAAVMIGVVNYNPWAAMVARRQAEARARLEAAEAAARAEEERLAAEKADRERRQREAEEARIAAEEAALAAARRIVDAEDDRIEAGRKFAERWTQMATDAKSGNLNPGCDLTRTSVVVDQTRKLTAGQGTAETVIGWEFLIRAEPGVLAATRAGSPFLGLRHFLSSMLHIDASKIELAYEPERENDKGEPEKLINHGVVTLSASFPLGESVRHPGASVCYIDDKGARHGFVGRDLRGQPVYRVNWAPGRPGGGNCVGSTGTGKSIVTQITVYNDLLLGIFPIIHDAGKRAIDFLEFFGIIPVGFTNAHRDVIRESIWAEMMRRYEWGGKRRKAGIGGMSVPAKSTWDPAEGGPPIRVVWEEFHMHMKDPRFVNYLQEQVRLQRGTAIMAETATQGGGLADMGNDTMRAQLNDVCSLLMRVSDHTAGLTSYTGGYRPMDLPSLPGMLVMQENRGPAVPFRSAIVQGADEMDPDSLIYRFRQPNGTPEGEQILFAPELPAETIAVFKQHGLMDLWELGKTESGRERLLSEADPVQSTVLPGSLEALLAQQSANVAAKPKMAADDVVLALLKHGVENGKPYLTQSEMLSSSWWRQIDGPWQKNEDATPAASTVHRSCKRLASTGEQPGQTTAKIAEKEGKQYRLLPAGIEPADQALTVLRSAGFLGQQGREQVRQSGYDVAALEREAMLRAEDMDVMQNAIDKALRLSGQQPS